MPITPHDEAPMRRAIEASQQALDRGDMPFGATLVSPQGELLQVSLNNQNTSADCTGHAEMVLVREAQVRLGAAALRGATVYASGEPCAMCSGAMYWAGIARVVYAASQADIGAALGGDALPIETSSVYTGASREVVVEGPLLRDAAVAVLRKAPRS